MRIYESLFQDHVEVKKLLQELISEEENALFAAGRRVVSDQYRKTG